MKAVTYAQLDLPRCGLTYGIDPCHARKIGDNLGTGYQEYFNGTLASWSALSATLTPALGGMVVDATGTDPIIRRSGLSFSGAANRYVTIEATRTSVGGTWDGNVFYTTGGHGESGSFFKRIATSNIFPVGERVSVTLDMHALTAGGTDWASNTITGIRIDFDQTSPGDFIVHSVRVGPLADATTATGSAKCYNTLATCQDLAHYDAINHPISMGSVVQTYTPAAGSYDPYSQSVNIGAVPAEGETRTIIVHYAGYGLNASTHTISSATLGGKAGTIRSQDFYAPVRGALIEFQDMDESYGTSATLSIDFSGPVSHLSVTVRRLIDADYVDETHTQTTNDNAGSSFPTIARDDVIFASTASWLLSSTAWTNLTEEVDTNVGGSAAINLSVASRLITEFSLSGTLAFSAQQADNSGFYTMPTQVGGGATTDGSPNGESVVASGFQLNDIVVVAFESQGGLASVPAGWTRVSGGPITDGVTSDLNVLWYRMDATGAVNQFFSFPASDHVSGYYVVIRGCTDQGDPVHQFASGQVAAGASTSLSVPGFTTTQANCLVYDLLAWAQDTVGPMYSGQANASLGSLTEVADQGTTAGTGGGVGITRGTKAAAGVVSATTMTAASNSGGHFYMKIALTPYAPQYSGIVLTAARYRRIQREMGTEETLTFGMDTGFNDPTIDSINCIDGYSHTPTVVSLGETMGTREAINFRMRDVKHSDVGPLLDKYYDERGYDPYEQGTFWPRLTARYPYFGGRNMRWYEGEAGQALAEMTARHFLIENIAGPDASGGVSVIGKDPLKLADSDKAVAPRPSIGYLLNDITDIQTSAVLTPSGVGDTYPTSGLAAIAGNELVTFTRSGDNLTIVREQSGTPKSAHPQQDHFQLALQYSAMDPADILYDLLVTYAGVNPSWIPLADWQTETASYLRRNYTAIIGEPTPVRKLINEIIQACGLALWWDSASQKIRLIVLREIPSDATVIDATVRTDRPNPVYQPDKRTSQFLVHFAIKDPLKSVTDPNNFRQRALVISAESERNYESSAIKSLFTRWIAPFARTTAIRVGDLNIGRFENAPRRLTFTLPRSGALKPKEGGAYRLTAANLQNPDGTMAVIPVQMVSVGIERDTYRCEAEEMQFTSFNEEDLNNRVITISGTNYNLNLKDIHDDIYPPLQVGNTVTFVFDETSKTGSNSATEPAVRTGTGWGGFVPHIEFRGKVQGKGGAGGKGANDAGNINSGGKNGQKGGTAFKADSAVTITDTTGQLIGGGGGGAGGSCASFEDHRGGGGGGGAGLVGGDGGLGPQQGEEGQPGTETAGGNYGRSYTSSNFWTGPSLRANVHGGVGGGPGLAGGGQVGSYDIPGGSAGAAGNSIEGIANVTTIGTAGTRLGPQV